MADESAESSGTGYVDGDTLRVQLPPPVANRWYGSARETIGFLGDPEASYVTGYPTDELEKAAMMLHPSRWLRGNHTQVTPTV